MTMSEHELEVLERLEQELMAPPALPSRAAARWSRLSVATPVVVSAMSVLIGLSLVLVGVVLNNVAGIALAAVAYLLMVGSAAVLHQAAGRARVAMARRAADRRGPGPRR